MSQKNDILNSFSRFLLNAKNKFSSINHTHTASDILDLSENDTKVTNALDTTTRAYVTATTRNETNTGTQIFDTGVYIDSIKGRLASDSLKTNTIFLTDAVKIMYEEDNHRIVLEVN